MSCPSKLSNLKVVLGTLEFLTGVWHEGHLVGLFSQMAQFGKLPCKRVTRPGQIWQSRKLCPLPCSLMDSRHLCSEEWEGVQVEEKTHSIWGTFNKAKERVEEFHTALEWTGLRPKAIPWCIDVQMCVCVCVSVSPSSPDRLLLFQSPDYWRARRSRPPHPDLGEGCDSSSC